MINRKLLHVCLIFSLSFGLLSSCSKSKADPDEVKPKYEYYVKFLANGQEFLFTDEDMDISGMHGMPRREGWSPKEPIFIFNVMAKTTTGKGYPHFEISIYDIIAHSPYPVFDTMNLETKEAVPTFVKVELKNDDAEGGVLYDYNSRAKVKITALDDKYVRGTFSAFATHNEDGTKPINITQGEFYVKRLEVPEIHLWY